MPQERVSLRSAISLLALMQKPMPNTHTHTHTEHSGVLASGATHTHTHCCCAMKAGYGVSPYVGAGYPQIDGKIEHKMSKLSTEPNYQLESTLWTYPLLPPLHGSWERCSRNKRRTGEWEQQENECGVPQKKGEKTEENQAICVDSNAPKRKTGK